MLNLVRTVINELGSFVFAYWFSYSDHSMKPHNIVMSKLSHDAGFLEQLDPLLLCRGLDCLHGYLLWFLSAEP